MSEKINPKESIFDRQNRTKLILAAITAVLMGVAYGFLQKDFPKSLFEILPLYVSLFVMLLQTNVNRYAFLLGAINSLVYGAVYISFKIYASALSAIAISFPLQLFTFFNWKRKPYGNSTMFKKLGIKKLSLCLAALFAAFIVCYFIFSALGSQHLILDNAGMIFGIFVTVLCALAYIDHIYLSFINQAINLALYVEMVISAPERLPYVIYDVFCAICLVYTARKVIRLYKQQKEEQENEK